MKAFSLYFSLLKFINIFQRNFLSVGARYKRGFSLFFFTQSEEKKDKFMFFKIRLNKTPFFNRDFSCKSNFFMSYLSKTYGMRKKTEFQGDKQIFYKNIEN